MDQQASKTPTEIIQVQSSTISCDGGDGAYGHPKVYLRIVAQQIMCPYCSRLFVLEPGVTDSGH